MSVAGNKVDAEELLRLLDCSDLQLANEIDSLIRDNLQSSREPWLLNSLIDTYRVSQSVRCMQILATVQEQHCKILLDRITDDVKGPGQQRLQALALFAFIVRRQPPWLYKVAKHSLMHTITKVLKTDSDVPVLMCGVLIITSIMPVIPVAITTHLSDIFEAFSRLIEFNKRKPGNVPDVYLLHLQVGLYALFHRLYGMYPCNFLTYLRATYSKVENRPVFEEYIKPMLERVRMHPLLVTASKDKELAVERWRHKEVHDIAVECAKMSLDPIEGWSEETLGPIFNYKKSHPEKSLPPLKMHIELPREQALTSSSEMQAIAVDQPLQSQDPFWSPATVCGLSTPPPVPISNAPFSTLTETQTAPQPQGPVVTPCSSLCLTPHTHVDSPLPHDETERRRLAMLNTHLAVQVQAQTVDGSVSVPPSPLKPDFTSEPPYNIHQMKAIRKINFDYPCPDTQALGAQGNGLVSKGKDRAVDVTPAEEAKEDMIAMADPPRTKITSPVKPSSVNQVTAVGEVSAPSLKASTSSVPSVTQLPQYIDSLEVEKTCHDKIAEEDIEVSELTQETIADDVSTDSDVGLPSHIPASIEMTAESVAAFMKQVNRIRFNSMNTTREKIPRVKFRCRSTSCPNLVDAKDSLCEADEESHDAATQRRPIRSEVIEEAPVQVVSPPKVCSETVVTHVSKVTTTTIQTQTSITATSDAKLRNEVAKEPETEAERFFRYFIETLLAPQCDNCQKLQNETESHGATGGLHASRKELTDLPTASKYLPTSPGGIPIYTTLSPPEMLDRQILLGGEVHAQEQAKIPLTSQGAVSWTHFGGVPPADEVTILRGQLLLLHNQLMFERHKCELHAKRNRRLLGRTVNTISLEEQYSAMQDQLRLQENEIQNLTAALRQQRQETSDLKEGKDKIGCELQVQQKSHAVEVDTLRRTNDMLKSQLCAQEEENRRLDKELQGTRAKKFCYEEELQAIKAKVGLNKELQDEVTRLNKELMLMGELQQKYQQRLTAMTKSHHSKPETQFVLESYKNELTAVRATLDQKTTILDSTKGRLVEAEENLKHRETSLAESKKLLEELRIRHKGEIQALEDKYQTQKKIQLGLHAQILDLYGQVVQNPPRENQASTVKPDKSKIKERESGARYSPDPDHSATPSPALPGVFRTSPSSEVKTVSLQTSEGSAFKSYQSGRQSPSSGRGNLVSGSMDPNN